TRTHPRLARHDSLSDGFRPRAVHVSLRRPRLPPDRRRRPCGPRPDCINRSRVSPKLGIRVSEKRGYSSTKKTTPAVVAGVVLFLDRAKVRLTVLRGAGRRTVHRKLTCRCRGRSFHNRSSVGSRSFVRN